MVKPAALEEGRKIRLRGPLRQEPVVFGQSQTFSLQNIKIKTHRFPEYHYGDYLIITGRLRVRVLNRFYKDYWLDYPKIRPSAISHQPLVIVPWLFKFKDRIETIYNSVLPEPQSSLLSGIVLGSKRGLPSEFQKSLKKTGTLHVVVASGANISLVSRPLVENLAGLISRRMALPIAVIFIWLYSLIAGFEPPVIRAAIMATVAFGAQFLGREKEALRSLVLAGVLMLLVKPLLIFDLGFQLSFAATLGILVFQPRLRPFFRRLSFFGDDLSTTLAAQALVLPIIYFNFKEFSLISPLVNALVLWTISPLMKMGGVVAGLGFLSQWLARLMAYPTWLFLTYFVKLIELFG